MEIYVVQYGDDIESIANKYGVSVERLKSDNGLINPQSLVVGQTIVILNPKETYIVKQGDTLETIALSNGISLTQLLRNNPFLYSREFIYPGDTLVLKFNTVKDIQVNGYTFAFIDQATLIKALPYLTFISVYNYRIAHTDTSSITSFGDDTAIIKSAKEYDTIPLLMISALSHTGKVNVESVYRLLLDANLQDKLINDVLQILSSKEFLGVNLLISYISEYNQSLYISLLAKISELLRNNGYIFMITISPNFSVHENLDYHSISLLVDRIIFLQDIWTKKNQPPAPISNISLLKPFIENVISKVSSNYISLGKPTYGLEWKLPFIHGSTADVMSLNSSISLAYEQNTTIQLDEESQTPHYDYIIATNGNQDEHKVWFIDTNSIIALDKVIIEHDLVGTGIWNVTRDSQLLFSITNSTYNIIKLSHGKVTSVLDLFTKEE